jgi:hypothetical protein
MRALNRIFGLLLLVSGIASSAQTRREDEPYCEEKSAKRVEITDADATILGLTIGRTSLKDVQAKLGKAEVTRVSREEESDVSVCYLSPTEGTVLVLYSGATGGWTDITQVRPVVTRGIVSALSTVHTLHTRISKRFHREWSATGPA